jgi:hypothetical protein
MEIAQDFQEFLGVPDLDVKDITISGSNAAYNYTPNSDIDLHLVVDLPEADRSEVYRELFDAKKFQYNEQHNITIGGYDVELYAQDVNQLHLASGLYSLLKGEWLRKPEYRQPAVDPKDVQVKSDYYIYAIKQMMEEIQGAGPEEAKDIMERASVLKKKISRSRDEQLAHKGGEFSVENLVFKRLRNEGWIGKLIDLKSQAYSHIYSEPSGALDSKFSTEADVVDESVSFGKGNTVVVMGPDVEGGRRLFVFYVDWAREVERAGRWVNMVGLTSPMIIRQEGGNLVAKPVAFNPQTLQKYAGLSDYQVVLNSKTKTPFWFETVKFSNHVQMIRALSNQLMGIPGVKLPQS